MTDHLANPDGIAYPPTVQQLATAIDNLEHWSLDRDDLRDAIEAAIAADREHRPTAPELDDAHAAILTQIYMSGFSSGAATAMLLHGATRPQAQAIGAHLAQHTADDPAMRWDLDEDVRHLWAHNGTPRRAGWVTFTAHSTNPHDPHQPRDHRDD